MRPALRLAWREIIKHRWRSLLVVVLIGLPILASVSAVTLIETGSISGKESQPYTFGAARAQLDWGYTSDDSGGSSQPEKITRAQALARVTAVTDLPVIADTWSGGWLAAGKQGWRVDTLGTDFDSPLAHGLADPIKGHLPSKPDEIAVTPQLAHAGAKVGSTMTLGGATVHIVGVAVAMDRGSIAGDAVLLPQDSPAELTLETGSGTDGWSFLVGGPHDGKLTDADVTAFHRAGFDVTTRDGFAWGDMSGPSSEDTQLIALLITCLLIEVVLLAGPAFAVGVRRQRRSLALLAVAGASPRDIRRTVLTQGLILGLGASILGALLSIPLTWLGLRLVASNFGLVLGPFDIGWLAVAPAVVLGTLSAVLASVVPARAASKIDVVTALAGRQPTPRVRAGWPIAGALVVVVGTVGCLSTLGRIGGDFANAWWAIVSVCGAVMLTPWLIATIARLAPLLPLPLRLALRDADRHRSRSAPAIAAVMASVSAVVALGLGSASETASNDRTQSYPYPLGTVTLTVDNDAQLDQMVAAIKQQTGVTFTPLRAVNNATVPTRSDFARQVVVADPATLKAWGVTLSPEAVSALAAGRALVDRSVTTPAGKVEIQTWNDAGDWAKPVAVSALATNLRMKGTVPGGPPPAVAAAVISPQTAHALHLDSTGWAAAIADRPAAESDTFAVRSAAASVDPLSWDISVTRTQHSDYWLLLLLLSLLGAFTVLLGTFSATGLALDDAKQDLTTLSAVGARPRTRRIVAGAHAFLIAFVGAVLGVIVGFTPGIAASWLLTKSYAGSPDNLWTFKVPWPLLLILLVALPIVAGVVTALVSRTRVVSLRRAA